MGTLINPHQHQFNFSRGMREIYCSDDVKMLFHNEGVFYGGDPLSKTVPLILFLFAIFYIISQILHWLLRPLKQPKYVSDMLAGIMIGPSGLGYCERVASKIALPQHALIFNTISIFAIIYYSFIVAVKIDTSMVLRFRKKVWAIGLAFVLLPFIVVVALSLTLNQVRSLFPGTVQIVLLASNVASSSVINLAPVLDDLYLTATDLAQLAISVATITDYIMWPSWALLKIVWAGDVESFLPGIVNGLALFVCLACIFYFMIQWIIQSTPEGHTVKEVYVLSMLLGVLVMAFVADCVANVPIFGALVLGMMVPDGPPLGSILVEKSEVFIKNCLCPFFFICIGSYADVFSLISWKSLLLFQLVMLAGYLAKFIGVVVPALCNKMSLRHALSLGLILNTRGVTELFMYRVFHVRKTMGVQFITQAIFSHVIWTAIVTFLGKNLYESAIKYLPEFVDGVGLSLQSLPSNAEMRILSCIPYEDYVPSVIWLLESSNPTEASPMCLYVVHLAELVGRSAPLLVHHKKHKRICKHNGCTRITKAFKSYLESTKKRIGFQQFTMIAPFKIMHSGICQLAQEKQVPLIIVPFHRDQNDFSQRSALSNLNSEIQENASCTVGIFVYGGTRRSTSVHREFKTQIAVIFLGGEDDREALAYGTRISGHHGVNVTVLRITLQDEAYIQVEKALDNALIDSFRTKNSKNLAVVYQEILVEDWEQAIGVVRSLDDRYDLMVVGRRHWQDHDDMDVWAENPELGFIGDIISSSDFYGGSVSVLVMQHCRELNGDGLGNLMPVSHDNASLFA